MAYVSAEVIAKVREGAKAIRAKYGVKLSFSGKGDSTLSCTISEGPIDFGGDYIQVNHYWLDSHFNGVALECLEDIKKLMYVDHWDKSDIQTDYFNCSFYVNIHVGKWNKPYILVK